MAFFPFFLFPLLKDYSIPGIENHNKNRNRNAIINILSTLALNRIGANNPNRKKRFLTSSRFILEYFVFDFLQINNKFYLGYLNRSNIEWNGQIVGKEWIFFFQIITPTTNTIVTKLSVGRILIFPIKQWENRPKNYASTKQILNLVDYQFIRISVMLNSAFNAVISSIFAYMKINSCKLVWIKTLWIFCYSLSFVSNWQFICNKAIFFYCFKLFKGLIQLNYFFMLLCILHSIERPCR